MRDQGCWIETGQALPKLVEQVAESPTGESRQAIGVAVVGGLLFSTVFTLVMIPVVHYGVIRAAERLGWNTVPPPVELTGSGI